MTQEADRADALMEHVISLTCKIEGQKHRKRYQSAIARLHIAACALRDAAWELKQ